MCRWIEEEVGPTVRLLRHLHFVGFFNMPVQAPIQDQPFNNYSEKPPRFNRLIRHALGYRGPILILNPQVITGDPGSSVVSVSTWGVQGLGFNSWVCSHLFPLLSVSPLPWQFKSDFIIYKLHSYNCSHDNHIGQATLDSECKTSFLLLTILKVSFTSLEFNKHL